MLTSLLRRPPRAPTARSGAARWSMVALLLWLALELPVVWLGNPSGALLVLTLVAWGGWAAGVSAALLATARRPLLTLIGVGVAALVFFGGFVFLGLLFLPAVGGSLALWIHWRSPRFAEDQSPADRSLNDR